MLEGVKNACHLLAFPRPFSLHFLEEFSDRFLYDPRSLMLLIHQVLIVYCNIYATHEVQKLNLKVLSNMSNTYPKPIASSTHPKPIANHLGK
jgi:hypothetical protein